MSLADWVSFARAYPAATEMLLGVAVLLTVALRSALHRTRIGRRLDSSLALLALGLAAGVLSTYGGAGAAGSVFLYTHAFFVAAVAIGAIRSVLILYVDFYLRERQGAAVSSIVRDVASVLTYFIIILAVLRVTLDINLASLVATSAVLTAIVGLALQDVLGSVVSGLVLELEDPFGPADWVRVGNYEGQIIETGWRTTRIRTRVNEVITLPNTYLAREPVVNYSRPDPRYGDTLHLLAGYEVAPADVKRALLAVLDADPAVLQQPEAEVRTVQYGERGMEYAVRYWITDFTNLERIRDRLMTNFWYALRRAGVRIPLPARDLVVHAASPAVGFDRGEVAPVLARVPLLAPLGPAEIETLAAQAQRQPFGHGEEIVREGAPGDSFYVIERGRVAVVIGAGNGAGRTIAELGLGECFGEMSLLAGEARSATVVAQGEVIVLEVGRAAFHDIVAANPAVIEPISQLAARRLAAQRAERDDADAAVAPDQTAQRLLQRIRAFFGV